MKFRPLLDMLANIDRRIVYLLTAVILLIPIICKIALPPASLLQARKLFDHVEKLANERDGRAVMISLDWGPQTAPELKPVTLAILKHLMYRKIPVVVLTVYIEGRGFLESVPQEAIKVVEDARKSQGMPEADIPVKYGRDWINVGYQVGWSNAIRGMASDFIANIKEDSKKKPLNEYEITRNIKNADDFSVMIEVTGLVGAFNSWLQWFKKTKTMQFGLGCTSISVPESYTYLDSGQLVGLFEGIAGAAAYEKLLEEELNIKSSIDTYRAMTAQMFGQGFIVLLVIIGNLAFFVSRRKPQEKQT